MKEMFSIDDIIMKSINEDAPFGDLTSEAIFSSESRSYARIISKGKGVIAGVNIAKRTFQILDKDLEFNSMINDGSPVNQGDVIANVSGNTIKMLLAERTALNLMQRLSGIATKTREIVNIVKDYKIRIVDTRKTTPGLRSIEKYAVRVGGGNNHRYCLSDGVLIKDNHIKAAGSIRNAVEKVRENIPHTSKVEVETETLEDVKEALDCGVEIIMLDNMSMDGMKKAVELIDKRALIEVSGNVSKDNVLDIAQIGVDIISMGSLTYSVEALDISMKFE
jgi:nicotinate-nucleotide pyrophosphorylase (carboxylating)